MVPKEWKIKTIGDIATVSSGGTPSRKEQSYWNGDIPWVTTAEVKFKTILDSAEKITKEGLSNSSAKLFPINTILMAMYGQGKTRGQVAKLGIEASTNQACAAIILSSDYCVDYYYQFLIYQYENIRDMSNSGSQENLSGSIVKSIPVPVPPYFEQQKIAKILSTWDQAISITEELLENSQQQKKALMQELLTGKKRLLDVNGERFSGEWSQKLVEEYFDVGSSKRVLQADWKSEGVPFYRTRELVSLSKRQAFRSEIFISDELFLELSQKYGIPSVGDFLISGVGTLGISYQVKDGDKFYFKDGNVLWFKLKNHIFSDYFKYCFQSDFVQEQIEAQASVTTVGTYTIQNAKKTKFWCPPSLQEQQKIAAVLRIADQEIETLQKKLDCLNQEKKTLMQQLLTGKKRVKVAA
ncbi:restriction endonuclease subunit S [Acinetobacter johnsonii]|uniref:restriction endonuclease subunit S n=1 Tax=Acinetobacter johnsonii TaxID=40214 RepID=UPI00398524FA